LQILDLTGFVAEQRAVLAAGEVDALRTPIETRYPWKPPDVT
jgi:hypothetical protein